MQVYYQGPPMDPQKKLEVANIVLECVSLRKWALFFLIACIIFALLTVIGQRPMMLIPEFACLILNTRINRKIRKLIDKATTIITIEAEKHRNSLNS